MAVSKAQSRASRKYNDKTYEIITCRSRKTDKLNDLLDIASEKAGISKASYIIDAIRAQLEKDGISINMLQSENSEDI